MNAKYKKVLLGDVVKINSSSYSAKDNLQYVNYLDTGNITNNVIDEIQRIDLSVDRLPSRAKRKVKYNSIIYSTVRPNQRHFGIIKEQPENFLVSTGFAVIDVIEELADADFIYYWLTQNKVVDLLHAIAEQSVSAYPSIKPSNIETLEILLPELHKQKRIASMLNVISEKIVINNSINSNLEQQVSTLYQAWFEDYINSDGVQPENWSLITLSNIADINSGKRPPMKSSEKTDDAQIPLVGAASVMGFTSEANHSDKILVTGRVGTHGVIQRFNTPCWTSDNTLVITSKYYEYVCQILKRIDYSSMNRGSTQPLITQGDMNKVSVLLPDVDTLNEFETLAGTLMAQYEANVAENNHLANIRDTLLPKLMSGEIDLSSIDI